MKERGGNRRLKDKLVDHFDGISDDFSFFLSFVIFFVQSTERKKKKKKIKPEDERSEILRSKSWEKRGRERTR